MDADNIFDRTLIPIMLIAAVIGAVAGFYVAFSAWGVPAGFVFAVGGVFLGAYCGMYVAGKLRTWT